MTQPVRISILGKINEKINKLNNITLNFKAANICNQIKMSSFLTIFVIRSKKVNFDWYHLIKLYQCKQKIRSMFSPSKKAGKSM